MQANRINVMSNQQLAASSSSRIWTWMLNYSPDYALSHDGGHPDPPPPTQLRIPLIKYRLPESGKWINKTAILEENMVTMENASGGGRRFGGGRQSVSAEDTLKFDVRFCQIEYISRKQKLSFLSDTDVDQHGDPRRHQLYFQHRGQFNQWRDTIQKHRLYYQYAFLEKGDEFGNPFDILDNAAAMLGGSLNNAAGAAAAVAAVDNTTNEDVNKIHDLIRQMKLTLIQAKPPDIKQQTGGGGLLKKGGSSTPAINNNNNDTKDPKGKKGSTEATAAAGVTPSTTNVQQSPPEGGMFLSAQTSKEHLPPPPPPPPPTPSVPTTTPNQLPQQQKKSVDPGAYEYQRLAKEYLVEIEKFKIRMDHETERLVLDIRESARRKATQSRAAGKSESFESRKRLGKDMKGSTEVNNKSTGADKKAERKNKQSDTIPTRQTSTDIPTASRRNAESPMTAAGGLCRTTSSEPTSTTSTTSSIHSGSFTAENAEFESAIGSVRKKSSDNSVDENKKSAEIASSPIAAAIETSVTQVTAANNDRAVVDSKSKAPGGPSPGKYRTVLPAVQPPLKNISLSQLVQIIRDGLPLMYFEPLDTLQRLCDSFDYAALLDRAVQTTKDSQMRMAWVVGFAISQYAGTRKRVGKPFNPILGGTYAMDRWADLGWRYVAEQVNHSPDVSAYHAAGRSGWTVTSTMVFQLSVGIKGGVKFEPEGQTTVTVSAEDGKKPQLQDQYVFKPISSSVANITTPALRAVVLSGKMQISSSTNPNLKAFVDFTDKTSVKGEVYSMDAGGNKKIHLFLTGNWAESVSVREPNQSSTPTVLYNVKPTDENAKQYFGFGKLAFSLNDNSPDIKQTLPPTDSRFRPDIRLLENGNVDAAKAEKTRLEHEQRKRRKTAMKHWTPLWFVKDSSDGQKNSVWASNDRYWPASKSNFQGINFPKLF